MSIQSITVNTAAGRRAQPHRHTIVPRLIAGLPLLGIGLVHIVDPELRMDPLVEAAGLPLVSVLAPLAVALEIIAGALLIAGAFARIGGLIAIPVMLVAVYAHLTIDVWPNGADNEPPILLPIAVIACAAYVVWRGAGRWSVDRWRAGSGEPGGGAVK